MKATEKWERREQKLNNKHKTKLIHGKGIGYLYGNMKRLTMVNQNV